MKDIIKITLTKAKKKNKSLDVVCRYLKIKFSLIISKELLKSRE